MVPYYRKHCVELVIAKSRASAIVKTLQSFRKGYSSLISATLAYSPGGASLMRNRDEELKKWVKQKETDSVILDVLIPKNTSDTMFFLQLKDFNTLQTDFGEKHHNKEAAYLVIYSFSKHEDGQKEFKNLSSRLTKALQKHFSLKRPPRSVSIGLINEKYENLLKKKHSTPPIPQDLLPTLELLKDTNFRNTIIRTKQAKDPTLNNIVKSTGLDESTVDPLLAKAVEDKILVRQYNVVCSSCNSALARVSSKSAISQMARDRVACPSCKAEIKDTSYVDCYVVADSISPILEKSTWMHMYVRKKLDPFIPNHRVRTSVIDGPNELDLIANMDGSLLLMELKDARFSIGHAYSFVGKCSQYKPDIPMIVTTEGVDKDVKEYIKNIGINTHYVEALTDLVEVLKSVFSQKNTQKLANLIGEVSWNTLIAKSIFSSLDVEVSFPEEQYPFKFGSPVYRMVE